MNNRYLIALAMLGLSGTVQAASPQWPADALDESDPRVQAYYAQHCDQWTNESNLQGQARDGFRDNCLSSAPLLWPVGPEADSGGDG